MNKTVRIMMLLVALNSGVTYGAHNQELFLRANKLYKEQAYEKALEVYNSIPDKGAAVWYNSGNCLYHLGKYADALVAFKRAQQNATNMQRIAIKHNIEQTLQALDISQASMTYRQRIYTYLSNALATTSLLFLQIMFLFFLYAIFLCMLYLRRSRKELLIGIVVLSSLMFLSTLALAVKYHDTWYMHGIVIRTPASIFVGPDKKYDTVSMATLADELIILEKRADWYKVKKGNLSGWMSAESVAEIN